MNDQNNLIVFGWLKLIGGLGLLILQLSRAKTIFISLINGASVAQKAGTGVGLIMILTITVFLLYSGYYNLIRKAKLSGKTADVHKRILIISGLTMLLLFLVLLVGTYQLVNTSSANTI